MGYRGPTTTRTTPPRPPAPGTVCRHPQTEPVELLVTGELVAQLCTSCLASLPASWDGELTEVHTWGQREPVAVIAHG